MHFDMDFRLDGSRSRNLRMKWYMSKVFSIKALGFFMLLNNNCKPWQRVTIFQNQQSKMNSKGIIEVLI